jgi:hypothetical protein
MQDTWDDISARTDQKALASASPRRRLLAAGYNSNPARLACYIERGGTGWRTLIPAETQMYLRIYAASKPTALKTTGRSQRSRRRARKPTIITAEGARRSYFDARPFSYAPNAATGASLRRNKK